MNYRLQFSHNSTIFSNREAALKRISEMYNPTLVGSYEPLYAEPYVVEYVDEEDKKQIILAIGMIEGDDAHTYHIVDTAHIEKDVIELSGATVNLKEFAESVKEALDEEIEKRKALQDEVDRVEEGAGLNDNGSYHRHNTASDMGNYIADAISLDNATVKLDKALKAIADKSLTNIKVNDVLGKVKDNVAEVTIDASNIKLNADYESENQEKATPHPLHNGDVLSNALATLEANYKDEIKQINGLHIVKITENLPANVLEAYDLVNVGEKVQDNSARINIYKDSALKTVYLGHTDDKIEDATKSDITSGSGDAALCFVYFTKNGTYELVAVNVEKFLEESEFKDGLNVNNHEVRVKIDDASEAFLTVSANGVKLSGVQDAINAASGAIETTINADFATLSGLVYTEEVRAKDVESALQKELDDTQTGAGLSIDGTYHKHNTASDMGNYIADATSLDNATVKLDASLKNEETARTNADLALSDRIDANKTAIEAEKTRAEGAEGTLTTNLNAEVTRATNAESALQSELDNTQSGAGLSTDGSYHKHNTASDMGNYIAEATSLDDAIVKLDVSLKGEEIARIAKDATLSGLVYTEEVRAKAVENDLQSELDATQIGAGLGTDGSYVTHTGTNYITAATSLDDAIVKLDASLKNANSTLSENINTLSGNVENKIIAVSGLVEDKIIAVSGDIETALISLSGKTNAALTKTAVSSADNSIIVTARTEGTDLKVNIDNTTIVKSDAGVLSSAIKIAKVTPSASNVKEEYHLVDGNNKNITDSVAIKVYKDSSLKQVYLGHMDDTCNENSGVITPGTGNTALCWKYQLEDGTYELVKIDVETFLEEAEFKDGLKVNNHEVSVQIDTTSEDYLTVSATGVKLSGVQNAINAASGALQTELNNTQTGAGLNADGSYVTHTGANYISESSSLDAAIVKLDASLKKEETARTNADTALSNRITDVEGRTIAGSNAIQVTGDAAKTVSLLIKNGESVLEQGAEGLRTNITLGYDSDNHKIYLYGKDNAVLGEVDASDFVKDGMVSSVSFNEETKKLTITFNTDAGKNNIDIDMSSLVDNYTVSGNSLGYLEIDNFKIGAKVDVDGGLASYYGFKVFKDTVNLDLSTLNGKITTLNGNMSTAGSVKHTIDDSLVKYKTEGTAVAANKTLVRYYMDDGDAKYYVSSDAADMYYKGESLETSIATLSGSVVSLSAGTVSKFIEVNTLINNLNASSESEQDAITALEGRVTTAEAKIDALQDELNTTKATLNTLLTNFDTKVYEAVANILKGTSREIKITANADNKSLTVGFADDAIFGPISLS